MKTISKIITAIRKAIIRVYADTRGEIANSANIDRPSGIYISKTIKEGSMEKLKIINIIQNKDEYILKKLVTEKISRIISAEHNKP